MPQRKIKPDYDTNTDERLHYLGKISTENGKKEVEVDIVSHLGKAPALRMSRTWRGNYTKVGRLSEEETYGLFELLSKMFSDGTKFPTSS